MIAIVKPGLLTTIQDLGRPGYAHLGVARSGALDAPALALANALVGNPPGAAGLETTLTGVSLRAEAPLTVAVTGADAPVTVDGSPGSFGRPVRLGEGCLLEVGPARAGVRSYVAVAGGIRVAPVLGSRSTDTLSGLGPPPMRTIAAWHESVVRSLMATVAPALCSALAMAKPRPRPAPVTNATRSR